MNITEDCKIVTAWPEGNSAGARRIGVLAIRPNGETVVGYIEAHESSDVLRQAFNTVWAVCGDFAGAVRHLMFPSPETPPAFRQKIIPANSPLPASGIGKPGMAENKSNPSTFSLKPSA